MKKLLIAHEVTNGIKEAFTTLGMEVVMSDIDLREINKEQMMDLLNGYLKMQIDYVFSYNFFPLISKVTNELGIIYICWVWDSPQTTLYSKYARNENNRIFLFDYAQYFKMKEVRGIKNVWYLPLAADIKVFEDTIVNSKIDRDKYTNDIAFVGNLYLQDKCLYDQISYLPDYVKGYLDSLMDIQMKFWGTNILEEGINDFIWNELKKYIKWDIGDDYEDGLYETELYSMLQRKIAQKERLKMCTYLATHYDFGLYTDSDLSPYPELYNKGYVVYNTEMPIVFNSSKINIHITLRSIETGLSLRVLDVLACGGFLLVNYQAELEEYFVDGEDLVVYHSFDDMIKKIDYYLEHDDERKRIALSGKNKVRELFSYERQIGYIKSVLEE